MSPPRCGHAAGESDRVILTRSSTLEGAFYVAEHGNGIFWIVTGQVQRNQIRVEESYLGNFVELLPHILQELGKITIPLVELQLLLIKYLLSNLQHKFQKPAVNIAAEQRIIDAETTSILSPSFRLFDHRNCGQSKCCRSGK